MKSWSTKRIKDLFDTYTGATPSSKVSSYWDGDIVWVTPADMTDFGEISSGETNITWAGYNSCSTNLVPKGSIVLSSRAPIGKVNIAARSLCTNQGCKSLVPKNVNAKFVAYYLYNSSKELDTLGQGTTFKELPLKRIVSFPVFLPSMYEQERIVTYLDEKSVLIEDRIQQLEVQAEHYSSLKVSLINEVTTRGLRPHLECKDSEIDWIGSIPKEWKRLRLKDVAYLYSGLTGKSGDDFRCEDDTLTKPFIPFTNVLNNNYIDFNQFNRVVMKDGEPQNQVKKNDLIFLMSSEDYESIAKSAVVIGDPGEVYLNSFCRGLRFTSKDVYAPFVNYQLNSEKYRDALRFEARGFTRINIKIDRIASQFITLPPYEEQVEIATYLDDKCSEIDSNIKNINDQIDALKALKKALINEIITGKRAV